MEWREEDKNNNRREEKIRFRNIKAKKIIYGNKINCSVELNDLEN